MAGEIPFLFAASLLGIARLRRWLDAPRARRARPKGAAARRPLDGRLTVLPFRARGLAIATVANFFLGPPAVLAAGSRVSGDAYRVSGHSQVLRRGDRDDPRGRFASS